MYYNVFISTVSNLPVVSSNWVEFMKRLLLLPENKYADNSDNKALM